MKITYPRPVAALMLGTFWAFGTVAGGTDSMPIAEEIAQLERAWKPGDGTAQYAYYSHAAQLGKRLSQYDKDAANAAALDLLNNIIAKRPVGSEVRDADFEVSSADLVALDDVARFALAEVNVPIGDRTKKIQSFGKFLGRIRAEAILNYAPQPVGRGLTIVNTPEMREQNEAAVRANKANNLTNTRQRALRDMEARFAKPIVDYLASTAATNPKARPLVRQAIADARLTDAEKAEVMKAMQ